MCKSVYETEDLRRYRRVLYVDFDIKPNTQYAFSFNTNQNGSVFYPNENIFTNSGAITVSSSDRNIFIGTTKNLKDLSNTDHTSNGYAIFKNNIDLSVAATFEDVQIEEKTVATDYVEHKEQVLPLTLGNIELCKIGDYQDYFYKESNKWYLHKEIAKKVLNGSENYTLVSAEGYVKFTSNQLINNSAATGICISSHFHLGTNAIGAFKVYNNNWVDIFTEIMTLEEFKTWLSNNNVSMYYACIPTDTEITDTTLISQLEAINNALSYEEQTNISSNTIALFDIIALRNMNTILNTLESDVDLLE